MFKQFQNLDFSASTSIKTDDDMMDAIGNLADKIHRKQETILKAALTAYYGVSDPMDCIKRVVRVVDHSGVSRFVDKDTGDVLVQFNNPSMRTCTSDSASHCVANYSVIVNGLIVERVKEALK